MYRYFLLYKPYQMVARFGKENEQVCLADLDFKFPKDVYPVGRLDADSEGMLVLTNDPRMNQALIGPSSNHVRTYLVQVEGEVSAEACRKISSGVTISIDGESYKTKPCTATKLEIPPALPDRNPPIRFRKNIPTSWIEIELKEGKNRQVRKMTAAAGFPTLRLVRKSIGGLNIDKMEPGEVREFMQKDILTALEIHNLRG